MEQEPTPPQRAGDNTLAVALAVLFGGVFLFYLDFIAFGIVGNVFSVFAGIAVVGSLHYLAWGHWLSKSVAAERAALRRQEALDEPPPLTQAPADAIQDLSRTRGIQKK